MPNNFDLLSEVIGYLESAEDGGTITPKAIGKIRAAFIAIRDELHSHHDGLAEHAAEIEHLDERTTDIEDALDELDDGFDELDESIGEQGEIIDEIFSLIAPHCTCPYCGNPVDDEDDDEGCCCGEDALDAIAFPYSCPDCGADFTVAVSCVCPDDPEEDPAE